MEYLIVMQDCIHYMENNMHEMHGFKDYEVLKMQRDLDWMLQGTTDVDPKRVDFPIDFLGNTTSGEVQTF